MNSNFSTWKWFWPDINVELYVSSKVMNLLSRYRQVDSDNERGGQLFIDLKNSKGLLLSDISIPHNADTSSYASLFFDKDRCKEEILKANRKGLFFAGYWHTHPEPIPHISAQDINSLRNFSHKNSNLIPYPIAIIVGRSKSINGIKAWSIRSSTVEVAIVCK